MKEQIPELEFQGVKIPRLGLGTWRLQGDECRQSVEAALGAGYRHIDTARMYGNEGEIGERLQSSGLSRSSLYLTSKVGMENLRKDDARREVERSLELLQTDYLDLVLIHWPNPEVPLEETLSAFGELQESGRVRRYGVSNFPPSLMQEAVAKAPIICNQVECYPLLRQNQLLTLIENHEMFMTAYSPLGQGAVGRIEELRQIGRKYGKTPEQVAIRWQMDRKRVVVIPRSRSPEHIRSNCDIFDFSLDEDDWTLIEALPDHQRLVDPAWAPDWETEGQAGKV